MEAILGPFLTFKPLNRQMHYYPRQDQITTTLDIHIPSPLMSVHKDPNKWNNQSWNTHEPSFRCGREEWKHLVSGIYGVNKAGEQESLKATGGFQEVFDKEQKFLIHLSATGKEKRMGMENHWMPVTSTKVLESRQNFQHGRKSWEASHTRLLF